MPRKFPHVLTILTAIMVLFTVLTWVVPAGRYERQTVEHREVVLPGTYERVEQAGQGLMAFLTAPCQGIVAAAEIIAFVFIVAGAFGIVSKTGAIESFLGLMVVGSRRYPKYKKLVVPLLMLLFSLGGATFGMAEEVLVFIMLTIPLARALGYDSIVGVSIAFVGAGAGFAGAFINPFTVGIAQGIAGLPPGSGFRYRLVCWAVFTVLAIAFVYRYANKIEKDPKASLLYGLDGPIPDASSEEAVPAPPSKAQLLVLLALTGGLILLVYGVQEWGWYIQEISALFLGLGLLCAALGRLSPDATVEAFLHGATDVLVAALIIGFARGLLVIIENGAIIDTMLHALASLAEGLPASISILAMFVFQSFLNFFVPSGSGQAALTMPLMSPLSDLLGIDRQSAVLAYQFGDGISNLVIPTSGITMGILEIAHIPYDRWLRFALPLVLILSLAAAVLLVGSL